MLYQARARLIDNVNGLVIPFGAYVETGDTAWVARFGEDLKRVYGEGAPSSAEVITVENTVEGKSDKRVKEEEPKKVEEEETSQKAKLQQRKSAKVVEESENK